MTVNAWTIGHHRTYDKTKTVRQQWEWLIELNDTDTGEGVVLTPHRLLQIVTDVLVNDPRSIDPTDLNSLVVVLAGADNHTEQDS